MHDKYHRVGVQLNVHQFGTTHVNDVDAVVAKARELKPSTTPTHSTRGYTVLHYCLRLVPSANV